MPQKDSPTTSTAETSSILSSPSPETSSPRRKSSITNPFKSLRDFKTGEQHKLPTASPNPNAFSPPAAGTGTEQDDFVGMMNATKGMTPEEVKSYLDSKEKRDGESYGKDVSEGSRRKEC